MRGQTYIIIDPQSWEDASITLCGITEGEDVEKYDFTLASIEDLRVDYASQIRLYTLGITDELSEWEGILVVKEGQCQWDENQKNYMFL